MKGKGADPVLEEVDMVREVGEKGMVCPVDWVA